jgi:hypothetical protein
MRLDSGWTTWTKLDKRVGQVGPADREGLDRAKPPYIALAIYGHVVQPSAQLPLVEGE